MPSRPLAIFVFTLLVAVAAFVLREGLPWTLRQELLASAVWLELVGLIMVAWPDIDPKVSGHLREAMARARRLPLLLRRVRSWASWQMRLRTLAIVNWFRRLRRHPQHYEIQGNVTITTRSESLMRVARAGTVDERLSRLETEMNGLPARWGRDFGALRDEKVAYRGWGLLLVAIGIMFNLVANYMA